MSAVPITLLTGFLGSGKTTLLKQLLSAPQLADTVVIINEFGEVSIDHLIVANLAESIVELRNGCLCCSIRGDLALTLHDLLYRRQLGDLPPFARIVIETSGLADPVPLAHTLMVTPALQKRVRLARIVTVVDALNVVATVDAHETAGDQIALADLLVLSKTGRPVTRAMITTGPRTAATTAATSVAIPARSASPALRFSSTGSLTNWARGCCGSRASPASVKKATGPAYSTRCRTSFIR